jgi:D-alanyl-D-alanine carboxypeptidase
MLAAACASEATGEPDPNVTASLQQVLDRAAAQTDDLLPGAISQYRHDGSAAWSGSAGIADIEARKTIAPNDRVRAGSILKTFLATVTLQHVEEGTLALDRPITELLDPETTAQIANSDRITLRMLLNHTSGIPEWATKDVDARVLADPGHIWTTDEEIALIAKQAPWFEPGTSWRYSNTDYTLVGMLLDRLGQGSWRDQVEARVLKPLQLESTSLPEPGHFEPPRDLAHGYQIANGAPVDLSNVDSSMAGAAGGHALLTTTADLSHFIDVLLDGRLFQHAETLTEMTTMIEAPDESGVPHRYGLGLESYVMPSGTEVIGHSGTTAGYAVMMFRIPAHHATLVTAVNAGNLFTNAMHVFMPSVDIIAGESAQP